MNDRPREFSPMLHSIRTDELKKSTRNIGTMVSVGCNGLYYFDWIHENLGIPTQHIGLEFYLHRPNGLPGNVNWIENTAGNMMGVTSCSVDLVFAGQTIEHLWADELCGFLLESARVVKLGGRMILDSPNRYFTQKYRWNHPEHTIELAASEMADLLSLSGFKVVRKIGHWLCRDAAEDVVLPLECSSEVEAQEIERRISQGFDEPENCYSWWIEAKRTNDNANPVALRSAIADLWSLLYSERVTRTLKSQSTLLTNRDGIILATGPKDWAGAVLFGSRSPLRKGNYIIAFQTDPYEADISPGHMDVYDSYDGQECVIAESLLPVRTSSGVHYLTVNLDKTRFGLEFRMWLNGRFALSALINVQVFRSVM